LTWKTYSPEALGFAVSMPREPAYRAKKSPDGSISCEEFRVDLGDRVYSAMRFPVLAGMPGKDPDASLMRVCKSMVGSLKGTITSTNKVRAEGLEGREVRFHAIGPDGRTPGEGRARVFLVDSRACILLTFALNAANGGEDALRFVESFRIASTPTAVRARLGP
jgi:hypothetical protein